MGSCRLAKDAAENSAGGVQKQELLDLERELGLAEPRAAEGGGPPRGNGGTEDAGPIMDDRNSSQGEEHRWCSLGSLFCGTPQRSPADRSAQQRNPQFRNYGATIVPARCVAICGLIAWTLRAVS